MKLGMLYHVYPRLLSDFVAQFMKKNVPGYHTLQAADDRWKDYFNELRKRVKKQRTVRPSGKPGLSLEFHWLFSLPIFPHRRS